MNQLTTKGIILGRLNYGEADRILTVLSQDQGKLRLMAKGVRKAKSKLAGSVELFSVSSFSLARGRGDISTLTGARLMHHYQNIVKDMERTTLAYELLRQADKATEASVGDDYFELLKAALEGLNDQSVSVQAVDLWFRAGLIRLAGHQPNLHTDVQSNKLASGQNYSFSLDDMAFSVAERGKFATNQIKFLRLCFGAGNPGLLSRVNSAHELTQDCLPLVGAMSRQYLGL
jgi:DNA repair protein RecO (recombination protein O)